MSYGLKKQISKLDPKMGYFGGPKKALENMDLKTNLVSNWDRTRRGRRRREEEEEKIKKHGCLPLVWNLDFLYGNSL